MQNPQVYQLFECETSTYTYLLTDPKTKEAVLIDPVIETLERDLKLIKELGVKLKYVLDTHIHADHITAAGEIRKRLGVQTAVSEDAQVDCVDIPLSDGQKLKFGSYEIEALSTPGHTDSCMSFYSEGMVFTGDALLIRGCGRTDFQQGSSDKLFDSVRGKLFTLPDETIVYPGHDYRGHTKSTIGEEKKYNQRLNLEISKDSFVQIMKDLKLANPKKIHEAVPANLGCGVNKNQNQEKSPWPFRPQNVDGVPEVTVDDLNKHMAEVHMIDVRRSEEFNNELGHIPGSKLVTLGPDLEEYLNQTDPNEKIVFICRSGGRSASATLIALERGFKYVANLQGGMLCWNSSGFAVDKK